MTQRHYLPAVSAGEENERGELAIHEDPESNPMLVYLRSLAPGSRPATTSALRSCASLLGYEGDVFAFPFQELRFAHTSALRAALAEKYSPAQTNKVLSAVRGVLKVAWRLELIDDTDYLRAVDVESVKGSSAQVGRAVETDEVALMLKVCAEDPSPAGRRDAALLAVGLLTGLRRAEIAALDLEDWVPGDASLIVRKGKGNKTRTVYVNEAGAAELRAWLKIRGRRHDGPLFMAINKGGRVQRDRRLSPAAVGDIVRRRAEQAGIEPIKAHDLRRSYISDLLDAGVDLSTVQQMAGHSSPSTTSGYDRRPARARREAAQRLSWPSPSVIVEMVETTVTEMREVAG